MPAGCTWRSSSTCSAASWSAGRRPGRCAPISPSTPLRWRSGTANAPAPTSAAWFITATGGVQYLSIRYADRLAENETVASVGSKGDSYDNVLAESFHGLYKWELIDRHGPWRGLDDVEFATLGYVDWFNHRRLHGEILDGPG